MQRQDIQERETRTRVHGESESVASQKQSIKKGQEAARQDLLADINDEAHENGSN